MKVCDENTIDLSVVSSDQVHSWYEQILLIRKTEECIANLVATGEAIGPCHLAIGQEAVAVGVVSALGKQGYYFGTHRSHAHYLASGGSVEGLLGEILERQIGCNGGIGGSMHLAAPEANFIASVPIVAATIPIAVGRALARKKIPDDITVCFFGDGATEEGAFHESLNLAASQNLRILFVCENNDFSSHLHLEERQPSSDLCRFAESHRISSHTIDGNNVSEIFNLISRLKVDQLLGGPVFVECKTYRMLGHVGHRIDQNVGLHRADELNNWKKRCPLIRLRNAILNQGRLSSNQLETIESQVARRLDLAIKSVRESGPPDASYLEKRQVRYD